VNCGRKSAKSLESGRRTPQRFTKDYKKPLLTTFDGKPCLVSLQEEKGANLKKRRVLF
jgi:hypothetical protein